ncbi:ArnT family glycosyltransferase [Candidatus Margulisiibacteriota bacterium]
MKFNLNTLREEKNLVIILLVISFLLFFFRIGAPSFFETDEVIYSQLAREIRLTGDFITLHFHSENWFVHPPLFMWLVTLSSFIFGESEFNSRLWCALFGMALVFVTYLLGKKMFKNGVGILAGFILATSFQFIIQSRLAIFDVPLAFFTILSVYFFFCWHRDRDKKYYYWFFAAMGLATLIKGPIGILLPMLVILPYLFLVKDLLSLFNRHIFIGAPLCFVIGGTWYLIEIILHGGVFFDQVIALYLVKRYTMVLGTHSGPWFYYFPVILIGFMPWALFLPFSLTYQAKRTGDDNNLFVIMWFTIVFIFFSMAATKLPGYILSLYPIMSISVAKLLSDFAAGENSGLDKKIDWAYKSSFILSMILLITGVILRSVEAQPSLKLMFQDVGMMIIILGIGGIASFVLFIKDKNIYNSVIALVVTMIFFTFYTANYTMIHLDEFKPMRAISRKIISKYESGDKIIRYRTAGHKNSFVFYIDKPIIFVETKGQLVNALDTNRRVFLIAYREDYYNTIKRFQTSFYIIHKAGDLVLLSNYK